jgi:ketosteroid isomerase-like protein
VNRGFDAWRRQAERLRDSWADARVEVDEIRSNDNAVVVRIRYLTTSGDTGLPFETPMAATFFFRDGRITLGQYYWHMSEALEAAGLSE